MYKHVVHVHTQSGTRHMHTRTHTHTHTHSLSLSHVCSHTHSTRTCKYIHVDYVHTHASKHQHTQLLHVLSQALCSTFHSTLTCTIVWTVVLYLCKPGLLLYYTTTAVHTDLLKKHQAAQTALMYSNANGYSLTLCTTNTWICLHHISLQVCKSRRALSIMLLSQSIA